MEIIRLDSVDSTNTYAKNMLSENKITHPCCVVSAQQTSGRGMGDHIWLSEPDKNLTFSLVCFPHFLPAQRQFQLNKMVALSVYDLIKKIFPSDKVSIKWPNDIFIESKKICGILIETSVIGKQLKWVVIGIGINVNQKIFSAGLPFATSLIQHLNRETDPDVLLSDYIGQFHNRYIQLSLNKDSEIDENYDQVLFRKGIPSKFIYREQPITATITGVNEYGWLQLHTSDHQNLECDIKEITFLI